jgi:hypothetical protein
LKFSRKSNFNPKLRSGGKKINWAVRIFFNDLLKNLQYISPFLLRKTFVYGNSEKKLKALKKRAVACKLFQDGVIHTNTYTETTES